VNELYHINEILKSGELSGFRANAEHHLGGKYVRQFEADFRAYFGVKHAISFNSATSALHAAMIACGVRGEVVVSPHTFSASASCALMVGANPVFADIQDDTFNIDPIAIPRHISDALGAVITVHLHGHSCDIGPIKFYADYYGYKVIEDCSQAIGATYKGRYVGTLGDCGVFSFNQFKHINTGEGGMLITKSDEIAEKARLVRSHGETQSGILGYNYRMTEITAAIGLERLKGLDENLRIRRELASYLTEGLSNIDGLTPPFIHPDCTHSFYTYAVKVDKDKLGITRDELQDRLLERGIYFGKGGLKPLHLFPFYGGHEGQFPIAERMEKEVMFTDIIKPPLTKKDIYRIIKAIKEVING